MIYAEIREYERDLKLNGLSPDNIIRRLIESSFDYLAVHPDLVALLNDENRNGAPHISSFRNLTPSTCRCSASSRRR